MFSLLFSLGEMAVFFIRWTEDVGFFWGRLVPFWLLSMLTSLFCLNVKLLNESKEIVVSFEMKNGWQTVDLWAT